MGSGVIKTLSGGQGDRDRSGSITASDRSVVPFQNQTITPAPGVTSAPAVGDSVTFDTVAQGGTTYAVNITDLGKLSP